MDDHTHKLVTDAATAAKEEQAGPSRPAKRIEAADLLTQRYIHNASDATYLYHAPVMQPQPYDPNKPDVADKGTQRRIHGTPFVRGANDENAVDPNDVKQGALGDCWLMSALIAVARAKPEAIENLIRDLGNGRYEVTLYIGETMRVEGRVTRAPVKIIVNDVFPSYGGGSPRYAGIGDSDATQGSELWVMLIEKAYAKHQGKYQGQAYLGTGLNARFESAIADLLPEGEMGAIPLGGTLNDLSGSMGQTLANKMIQSNPELLAGYLQKCLDEQRPVTAMTKVDIDVLEPTLSKRWGVPPWHHYALRSVDVPGKTMCWQNPWGTNDVNHIPVTDFIRLYAHIQVGPSLRGLIDSPIQKQQSDPTNRNIT